MTNIRLPQKFIDKLILLPENGMGYQTVMIKLKSGQILTNRIVLNSEFLKLMDGEELNSADFYSIDLIPAENGS